MQLSEIDRHLTDPDVFAGGVPHDMLAYLRENDPVHWTKGQLSKGFWSLTRYHDIEKVYRDPQTFSSQRNGIVLPVTPESEAATPHEKGAGLAIFSTDPPRHRELRQLFESTFSSRVISALEGHIRTVVIEVIEAVRSTGETECDFVHDIALQVPLRVISDIMGIPEEDRRRVMSYAERAMFPADETYRVGSLLESAVGGFELIVRYSLALAHSRRETPTEDLTNVIAHARIDGQLLDDEELGWNVATFIMGGLETARNAASGGMMELLRNPDQFALLQSDPTLIPNAVEEVLRWSTPSTHNLRTATKDTEIGGRQIKEDDWVVLWLASANRDEAVFEDPFKFNVRRKNIRHLAFGHGPHFCIGRLLARMEVRIMFEEILARLPDLEVAGPSEGLASNLVAGLKRMPVRF